MHGRVWSAGAILVTGGFLGALVVHPFIASAQSKPAFVPASGGYCCNAEESRCYYEELSAASPRVENATPNADAALLTADALLEAVRNVAEQELITAPCPTYPRWPVTSDLERSWQDALTTRVYQRQMSCMIKREYEWMLKKIDEAPADDAQARFKLARSLFYRSSVLGLVKAEYLETVRLMPGLLRDINNSITNMENTIAKRGVGSCWAWKKGDCKSEQALLAWYEETKKQRLENAEKFFWIPFYSTMPSRAEADLRRIGPLIRGRSDTSELASTLKAAAATSDAWIKAADYTIVGIKWTRVGISTALTVFPPGQKVFDLVSTGMDVLTGQMTLEEAGRQIAIDLIAGKTTKFMKPVITKIGARPIAAIALSVDNRLARKLITKAGRKIIDKIASDLGQEFAEQLVSELERLTGMKRDQLDDLPPEQNPNSAPSTAAQSQASVRALTCGDIRPTPAQVKSYTAAGPFATMIACQAACQPQARSVSSQSASARRRFSISAQVYCLKDGACTPVLDLGEGTPDPCEGGEEHISEESCNAALGGKAGKGTNGDLGSEGDAGPKGQNENTQEPAKEKAPADNTLDEHLSVCCEAGQEGETDFVCRPKVFSSFETCSGPNDTTEYATLGECVANCPTRVSRPPSQEAQEVVIQPESKHLCCNVEARRCSEAGPGTVGSIRNAFEYIVTFGGIDQEDYDQRGCGEGELKFFGTPDDCAAACAERADMPPQEVQELMEAPLFTPEVMTVGMPQEEGTGAPQNFALAGADDMAPNGGKAGAKGGAAKGGDAGGGAKGGNQGGGGAGGDQKGGGDGERDGQGADAGGTKASGDERGQQDGASASRDQSRMSDAFQRSASKGESGRSTASTDGEQMIGGGGSPFVRNQGMSRSVPSQKSNAALPLVCPALVMQCTSGAPTCPTGMTPSCIEGMQPSCVNGIALCCADPESCIPLDCAASTGLSCATDRDCGFTACATDPAGQSCTLNVRCIDGQCLPGLNLQRECQECDSCPADQTAGKSQASAAKR